MPDAGLAGLAFLVVVQAKNEFVGRIVERNETQVRLKRETRTGVESGDLIESERVALCAVESFDKSPLDAGDVDGEAMAAAGELRVGGEPLRELGAEIAQRKRTAGMRGEIRDGEALKGACPDDGASAGKSSASAPSTRNQYWRL